MKITNIEIERYEKGFISETRLGKQSFKIRIGWYIKIYSGKIYGIGEAAPIPGISEENYEEVGYALNGFKIALDGIDYNIKLEELLLLSEVHGFNVPSVQFAIESAIYSLFSQLKKQSVAQYLNANSLDIVNINSIHHSQSTIDLANTKVLKIKIDEKNIFSIKQKIEAILKKYPKDIKIRLDFNGILDLPRAIRICKEVTSYDIDYIEQPIDKDSINDFYNLRTSTDIPIAVDESITNYESAIKIINASAADILIIKPTLTGSLKEIKKIISLAKKEGLRVIITSSFETSIAQSYILNLIAALEISEYCGVFNIQLFQDEIGPTINNSQCKVECVQ